MSVGDVPGKDRGSEVAGIRCRRQSRGLGSYFCSHFAPITPRNRVERDEERRTIRQRGTACCLTSFPQRSEGYRTWPCCTHNPKVAGSNPAPATNKSSKSKGPTAVGPFGVSARL